MSLRRGNCLSLSVMKSLQTVAHASCHWTALLMDDDDDDDEPLPADWAATYRKSRNYSVFAQIGVSPTSADGRRRLRVSLWAGMSAEHDGSEPLLGAPIDVDHEVEVEPGTPTFLKFRESREVIGATDEHEQREHVAFPGGMLIACIAGDNKLTLFWSFSFAVAGATWDLMDQQVDIAAATLLGAPQAPPVRPVAKTMEQSLAEARAKRQRGK